ncbi:MAG: hypothetical protein IIY06_07165 [Proteobacteria bacterium]|nr:hypothetical protein [Pseudomonadota bacterium]
MGKDTKDASDSLRSVGEMLDQIEHMDQSNGWLDAALNRAGNDILNVSDDSKGQFSKKLSMLASEKMDGFFFDDDFSFFENTMKKNAEDQKAVEQQTKAKGAEESQLPNRSFHSRITRMMNDESLNADPRESSSLGFAIAETDEKRATTEGGVEAFDQRLFDALNAPEKMAMENKTDASGNSFLRLGQLVSPVSDGVRISSTVLPGRGLGKKGVVQGERVLENSKIQPASQDADDVSGESLALSAIEACLVDENNDALNCSGEFSLCMRLDEQEIAREKQEDGDLDEDVQQGEMPKETVAPDIDKEAQKAHVDAVPQETEEAPTKDQTSAEAKLETAAEDVSRVAEATQEAAKSVSLPSHKAENKVIVPLRQVRLPGTQSTADTRVERKVLSPLKKNASEERAPVGAKTASLPSMKSKDLSQHGGEKQQEKQAVSATESKKAEDNNTENAQTIAATKNVADGDVSKSEDVCVRPEKDHDAKPLTQHVECTSHVEDKSVAVPKKQQRNDDSEIYASRFFNEDGHVSTLGFAKKHDDETTKKSLRLLHPDDSFFMKTQEIDQKPIRFTTLNYVYDHLFIHKNRSILGRIPTCIGRISELERMMQKIFETSTTLYPKLIEVSAEGRFEIEMFIESMLERCLQRSENMTFYATCDREICESGVSCLRSLIASRINYSPEHNVKTERIIRSAVELVDAKEKLWAQNTLYTAFGLDSLVIKNGDASEQSIDLRLLELFMKGLMHDAECGPVVVLLTHADKDRYDGWREVISHIRKLNAPNITLVVCGDGVSDFDGVERLVLGRIPDAAMKYYASEIFRQKEELPNGIVDALVMKSMGSYTRLWNIIKLLELRGIVKQQEQGIWIHPEAAFVIKAVSMNMSALFNEHFSSLSDDQRYLYSVAAILDEPFRMDDMSAVLSLDALEGDIPWFHNLRKSWTERVVQELLDRGELQIVDDGEHLLRYVLSDRLNARYLVQNMEPTYVSLIHGCYAQILQQHSETDPRVAFHFEMAGMWTDAAQAWLQLEQYRREDYFNLTSLELLNHCLTFMAPQYGNSFLVLQRELGCLATRFGIYDTAYEHYSAMLRVAQFSKDIPQSIEAFLGIASSLLMLGHYKEAREMMSYGVKLAEQFGQRELMARCYRKFAEIIFRTGGRGTLSVALRYVERANEIWRDLAHLTQLAITQTLAAEIFMVRGDLARTRAALSEAFYALKNSGMWFETPPVLAAFAQLSICEKKYRDAANYLKDGMEIANKTDNLAHRFELLCRRVELNIAMTNRDAVREDLLTLNGICEQHPCTPWIVRIRLLTAQFDFSRNSFQKTTRAIKAFFEVATNLQNSYLMGIGYALSAKLNFEVFKRQLGRVSLEKTDKLFGSATTILESIGAWHLVAENLRYYADFLDMTGKEADAKRCRDRAEKVDPFCQ